jgi:hypothetical protein
VLDEQEGSEPMLPLPIITIISAGSVALLIYFGVSFWREAMRLQHHREQVVRLRAAIARKRRRNRLLHLYRIDPIELLQPREAKKL